MAAFSNASSRHRLTTANVRFRPIADIRGHGHFRGMEGQHQKRPPIGCARPLLTFNTILIGLVTFNFAQGPYSSGAQEFWYRYISIALLVFGSLIPAIMLWAAPKSRAVVIAAVVLMLATFVVFVWYGMNAGGGV